MEENNLYLKFCKYEGCQRQFVARRLNQEYHSSECKMKANNSKAADERLLTKEIDEKIKRNRKILDEFYSAGKTIVGLNELTTKGFDYLKHTGRCPDKNGKYTILQFHNFTLEKININQFKINKLW